MNKLVRRSVILLIIIGIIISSIDLIGILYFELQGFLGTDAHFFRTVGQGIVNGIKPYVGLYEPKPPIIFILNAISLKLFEGTQLVKVLQIIILLAFPISFFIYGRKAKKGMEATLLFALFGLLLAGYVGVRAGGGLTESFGALFGCMYIMLIASGEKVSRKRSILLGFLLAITVGFKEPFLLTVFAGTLILVKNPKDLCWNILIPFVIAFLVGSILLLIFGYFGPYFFVNLPHAILYRSAPEQLIDNIINSRMVWVDHARYSSVLVMILICLWAFSLLYIYRSASSVRNLSIRIVFWITSIILVHLVCVLGGRFYSHAYVMAVPTYIAMFLFIVREGIGSSKKGSSALLLIFALYFASFSIYHERHDYDAITDAYNEAESWKGDIASLIDTTIDRCNVDRYMNLVDGGSGPTSKTRYSPDGPMYMQYENFGRNAYFKYEFLKDLQTVPLILIYDNVYNARIPPDYSEYVNNYVWSNFSKQPWPCAEPFVQPADYYLLFRNQT